jgi:hypothetical protein
MKPTFELHKLKEEFIITSHEDIQEDDFVFANDTNVIFRCNNHEANSAIPQFKNLYEKLTAQQDQIDFSGLLEKEQKEIGWFDVEKLAKEMLPNDSDWQRRFDIIKGFQKAQELLSDRMFTLEDMRNAFQEGINKANDNFNPYHGIDLDKCEESKVQYIQSISQKAWKVELEMEYQDMHGMWFSKPTILSELDRPQRPKLTNGKIKILKIL